MKIIGKIFAAVFSLAFAAFALTQIIYWLNLDNKLVFRVVYPVLQKHYDKIERDRRF